MDLRKVQSTWHVSKNDLARNHCIGSVHVFACTLEALIFLIKSIRISRAGNHQRVGIVSQE
jgi:hypothetical protein